MPESSTEISWQEWASASQEAESWPTDVGDRVRTLARHSHMDGPLTLRLEGSGVPVVQRARIYVCGITPYDTTHLGHAATFIWADLAARVFRLSGVEAEVCRNVTDVDDHLLDRARDLHVGWRELASEQTYRFEHDMTQLGLSHPTYEPRSFDHVDDVIALASGLLAKGFAYTRNGCVYFKGAHLAENLEISRDEAITLARERGGHPDDPDKDDPLDSVLWRRSSEGEPAWSSPWGKGRPGWHAECSAMALATFGSSMDLHVGGSELAFPHHAYEAAQAESFTGVAPFSRSWLHVGTVMVGDTKMAKSAGNLVFVGDLIERYGAGPLRLLILDRDARDPWRFEESDLHLAAERIEELSRAAVSQSQSEAGHREVVNSLLDDLNVSRALEIASEARGEPLRDLMKFLSLI